MASTHPRGVTFVHVQLGHKAQGKGNGSDRAPQDSRLRSQKGGVEFIKVQVTAQIVRLISANEWGVTTEF